MLQGPYINPSVPSLQFD